MESGPTPEIFSLSESSWDFWRSESEKSHIIWLVMTGTLVFDDFPFSWEWNI